MVSVRYGRRAHWRLSPFMMAATVPLKRSIRSLQKSQSQPHFMAISLNRGEVSVRMVSISAVGNPEVISRSGVRTRARMRAQIATE